MKPRIAIILCALLGLAVIAWFARSKLLPTAGDASNATGASRASSGSNRACDNTATPEAEQRCFMERAASGRYQEIIDAVEERTIGLTPYQEYFAGVAYYALANRTAADSLRCYRNERAKIHLENFLVHSQEELRTKQSLQSAEEMKYAYIASTIFKSFADAKGCPEPGESLVSLERFARKYVADTVESLFFNYGTPGALRTALADAFNLSLGHVQESVRQLVGTASRLETDFALTGAEIDVAWRELDVVVEAANAWMGKDTPPVLEVTRDEVSGARKYSFTPKLEELLQDIARERATFTELASEGGELGRAKARVDAVIVNAGASGMERYVADRAQALKVAQEIESRLNGITDGVQTIMSTTSAAELEKPRADMATGLQLTWTKIEQQWKAERMGCAANPNKWFCKP
jgi:hypothetical protein